MWKDGMLVVVVAVGVCVWGGGSVEILLATSEEINSNVSMDV